MDIIDRVMSRAETARGEALRRAELMRAPRRSGPGWRGTVLLAAAAGVGGALVAWLLDPDRGRSRRAQLGGQAAGTARRVVRQTERAINAASSTAAGKLEAARHADDAPGDLDDATLTAKVETELFRDPSVPKGALNVNVERGIAVLRGEVPDEAMRQALVDRAAAIGGVWSVRNLLHLPGEPAGEEVVGTTAS